MTEYQKAITGFRPQFGNANHIAAARMIEQVSKLQARLDKIKPGRRPPAKLMKELNDMQKRVIGLLNPATPMSTYPPTYPPKEV